MAKRLPYTVSDAAYHHLIPLSIRINPPQIIRGAVRVGALFDERGLSSAMPKPAPMVL